MQLRLFAGKRVDDLHRLVAVVDDCGVATVPENGFLIEGAAREKAVLHDEPLRIGHTYEHDLTERHVRADDADEILVVKNVGPRGDQGTVFGWMPIAPGGVDPHQHRCSLRYKLQHVGI